MIRFVGALVIASAFAAACAMSAPADLTSDVDLTLPGVDAASNPLPAQTPGNDAAVEDSARQQPRVDAAVDAPVDAPIVAVVPKPTAGEVLITEVMYAPTTPEPDSEWMELHNVSIGDRSLAGLILKDGASRTHVIVGPLTIPAGAWVVLARRRAGAIAAKVPASSIVYEYGATIAENAGVLLANGTTGGVSLLNGSAVLATAPYGGWFSPGGSSVQLSVLSASQSSVKASWCLSAATWTTGSDKGTPGAANSCP